MLRINILLAISLLFPFFTFCQDSTVKHISSNFAIQMINSDKFLVNGEYIDFDSCQILLSSFNKSDVELKKAPKFKNRSNKYPWIAAFLIPELGFGVADQVTNYKYSWVDTTFICVAIPFIVAVVYILRNQHQLQIHLKRAIDQYNAQIIK